MDTNYPPSKIARLTDSGSGSGCWSMNRNGSPPIGLGLALGTGGSTGNPVDTTKSYGFTIVQVQELQLQTVIYRYIESGCPVPYHLLVPIWSSVSNSYVCLNSNVYYPSFMRGNREMQMAYRNGMDPEPGRCRRTDGKKWRCTKEAVTDQKYCERHMHRGRQRTRKLMEVASHINNNHIASTNLSISINPSPNSVFSTGKN